MNLIKLNGQDNPDKKPTFAGGTASRKDGIQLSLKVCQILRMQIEYDKC